MAQHYSDPEREDDAYTLPDVETFYLSATDFLRADDSTWMFERMREIVNDAPDGLTDDELDTLQRESAEDVAGWYYWFCFPGCLPDGEPMGPYATEAEAVAAAQDDNECD